MTVATRWGVGIIVLVLLPWSVRAGDILYHHIGDTITPHEASTYELFEDVVNLDRVVFTDDGSRIRMVVVTRDSSGDSGYEFEVSDETLALMNYTLNAMDAATLGRAPDSPPEISLRTGDGYVATGTFQRWTGTALVIRTDYGENTIPLEKVDDLRLLDDNSEPFKAPKVGLNPNKNRLLFMPTGRSLDAGEGYFGVYEVVIPMVHVGLGYNISIGGGIFPVLTSEFTLGYLSAQVGLIDEDEGALAVGNLTVLANAGDETNSVGINYVTASFGSLERSFSTGIGFGFTPDGLEETPFVVLGGQFQLSHRTAIITENWLIPGMEVPTVSLGLRWFSESIAADFALLRPLDDSDVFAIPWVNFVVHFGHKD